MSTIEMNRVKNAPLSMPEDREGFVRWAMEEPDGCFSAGRQPPHPRLCIEAPAQVLRTSAAKLMSLARREKNQTPEQTAASAGVRVSDVLALEHGEKASLQIIVRVAAVLQLDADVLIQLFSGSHDADARLIEAATQFVARLEPADPLEPREAQALGWFRNAAFGRRAGRAEVG
jgi:transcriptional regulator with XRE-family HTH domain